MIITILGSGTCVPSLERSASCIWVRSGNTRILIDAGIGCTRRLLEAGGHIKDLDGIFLTHFHPDHSAELVPILFSLKYSGFIADKKITLTGGYGFKSFCLGLSGVYGKWIDCSGYLDIKELKPQSFEFGDFVIETFHVEHRPESLAYKITDKSGHSFVFSGDMDLTSGFEDFCKGTDILIMEASTPDNMKVKGHITPFIAAETAGASGCKKLILTHFYPQCDVKDFLDNARKIYKEEIILAKDLMEIRL